MSLPCSGISTKTKTWFTWRSSPTCHMYQWLQATVVGWQQTSPFGMLLTSKGKGYTGAVLTLLQTKKHDKSNSPIRFTISSCTAACFRSTIPSSFHPRISVAVTSISFCFFNSCCWLFASFVFNVWKMCTKVWKTKFSLILPDSILF